jgi:hypothetical protein
LGASGDGRSGARDADAIVAIDGFLIIFGTRVAIVAGQYGGIGTAGDASRTIDVSRPSAAGIRAVRSESDEKAARRVGCGERPGNGASTNGGSQHGSPRIIAVINGHTVAAGKVERTKVQHYGSSRLVRADDIVSGSIVLIVARFAAGVDENSTTLRVFEAV